MLLGKWPLNGMTSFNQIGRRYRIDRYKKGESKITEGIDKIWKDDGIRFFKKFTKTMSGKGRI